VIFYTFSEIMLLGIQVVADGWVSWAQGYLDEAAATFEE
jgi:hypothetical protein